MTFLSEYLRRGPEVLELITKDEFDRLLEDIRRYRIGGDSVAPDEGARLLGETSHYYGLTGTKIAQIYAIKMSVERQIERAKTALARQHGVPLSKRAEIDRLALEDEKICTLVGQSDEIRAVELYFVHMRETLYMLHYALRRECDYNSGSHGREGARMRVNHG